MNGHNNPFLTIQYHLYEHPLYTCCPIVSNELKVLIIGFEEYGQLFLDACLQNGQIRNKTLSVSIVLDDLSGKNAYLSKRPELSDFFSIDGSLSDRDDIYGRITFEFDKIGLSQKTLCEEVILQTVLLKELDKKRPHYIFVSLGNDLLNKAVSNVCKVVDNTLGLNCLVSYICEKSLPDEQLQLCYPISLSEEREKISSYDEIERMAFNSHLVWEKSLNVDYRTVRLGYRKKYNHNSCVSSVLSLKSKLYSIGIDIDTICFADAAKAFVSFISDKRNRGIRNELIWIEHRRWVTEKLCLGWRRLSNLEDCVTGITKDEKRKKHVCIVRSRPDQKLAIEYRQNDNYEKWDTASTIELNQLDELDQMSVRLHRVYAQKAKMAHEQNLLSGNFISAIRALIEGDKKSIVTFQEWFTCLKDIWNGDAGKVHQYKGLKTAFLRAIDGLSVERKRAIGNQVKAFEAMYYPVLACTEHRDWKQNDVAYIDNIPFILTYTEKAYLVIPYATGDNTAVFGNVAASTVVSPARILYLYYIEKKQSLDALCESIPYIIEYMRKKNFKAAVEFVLIYPEAIARYITAKEEKNILQLGNGRIRQVKRIVTYEMGSVSTQLSSYLMYRCKGKRFFAVEKNSTALSYMLQGAGFYKGFPYYQFDSCAMKFHEISNCEMLECIKKAPYITVTDMAAFKLSSSESSNHPEFFADYKELWKKYQEKTSAWKSLCDTLSAFSEKNDILALFKRKPFKDKSATPERHTYILPITCYKSVARILDFLIDQEILEPGSYVVSRTTDSCEVEILDRCGYHDEYNKLFANVFTLMLPDYISVHLNKKSREAKVVFDNLVVTGAQINTGRAAEVKSLLEFFRDKGYIINLVVADDIMSFTYSTLRIKDLLTTAGKMLEVYTYHKVKELGRFDDVVSSFEIDWEQTDVKSEFDCILTKGFRSLFVECKARMDLEQDFYYKIAELTNQFGINATAVLVADTQEKPFYANASTNAMQRRRGNMMNVVTIWKTDEINNIGHTLLKIINGMYTFEEEKERV